MAGLATLSWSDTAAPVSMAGAGGAECQDGQVFFLGADDFDSMTERYAEIRKRQDAAAATARKILGAEHE